MRLLHYSPISYGGIADYAHAQANALVDAGVEVTMLCSSAYRTGRGEKYAIEPSLREPPGGSRNISRRLAFARTLLHNAKVLEHTIIEKNSHHVLLSSYSEYLAPLWAGRLKRLADDGVRFGAIVHDPVRDFVVGPHWWHRRSIAAGYSFLSEAFIHAEIDLNTVRKTPNLRTTVIVHGVYTYAPPSRSSREVRKDLGIPPDAKVLLSFGGIRDNKNLNLVLEAMQHFDNLYLIIAGHQLSRRQKPAKTYVQMAQKLGVSSRCRWDLDYIERQAVANYFNAVDIVVLTYNDSFHSASGVHSTAVYFRKPCIVSSGYGPLRSAMETYNLGRWVAPDSVTEIRNGIRELLLNPVKPDFDGYIRNHTWGENAARVIHSMFDDQK